MNDERGVTIVELIVVSALVLVLGGAIGMLFFASTRTESHLTAQVNLAEEMRVALEQFSRDARHASAVSVANCTEFTFTSYFRTATPRTVTYRVTAGTVSRTLGSGSAPLITGLSSATFRNPAAPAAAANCGMSTPMRSVRLELSGQPRQATTPITLGSTVTMRNRS